MGTAEPGRLVNVQAIQQPETTRQLEPPFDRSAKLTSSVPRIPGPLSACSEPVSAAQPTSRTAGGPPPYESSPLVASIRAVTTGNNYRRAWDHGRRHLQSQQNWLYFLEPAEGETDFDLGAPRPQAVHGFKALRQNRQQS